MYQKINIPAGSFLPRDTAAKNTAPLFCWGEGSTLFTYNKQQKNTNPVVEVHFQPVIPESYTQMVKQFCGVFEDLHMARHENEDTFVYLQKQQIDNSRNGRQQNQEISAEDNYIVRSNEIAVVSAEKYANILKQHLKDSASTWPQQLADEVLLGTVYLEFVKSLVLDKQQAKLKKEPYSKSENIVRLLNFYNQALHPGRSEELSQLGDWMQIYDALCSVNISKLLLLLNKQTDYDKKLTLNTADALKIKKYFFQGVDATLIPKHEFIRRHQEFQDRIAEILSKTPQKSELEQFLKILSGNLEAIRNQCQGDVISFIILYILFANPLFKLSQLKKDLETCGYGEEMRSTIKELELFLLLVTEKDSYATIQKAQDVFSPFFFFHLIDLIQVADFTCEQSFQLQNQLAERNYREEIQVRFMEYLQHSQFEYRILSVYVSNFLSRAETKSKQDKHSQIFETLLLAKSNSLTDGSQINQNIDDCLSDCVQTQLKAIAMNALRQNNFGHALELFIKLSAFQISHPDNLSQNNNINEINNQISKAMRAKLNSNYKYLRELISERVLFCGVDDSSIQQIATVLSEKSSIFGINQIHGAIVQKNFSFLFAFTQLQQLVKNYNQYQNINDNIINSKGNQSAGVIQSIEQSIYYLFKLQKPSSDEIAVALLFINSNILYEFKMRLSQNIYDLLLSAAHTLLKSLAERLELELALQTKGLKLQRVKNLQQQITHIISVIMNSYAL